MYVKGYQEVKINWQKYWMKKGMFHMSKYDINYELISENIKTLENKIINSLPKEEELSHDFSKKFQKKMNKLIRKEKRTPFMQSFISYGKRAAVVFLIVISISFVTTMSVEAYRVRFFQVITEVWEEFTSIIFKSEENTNDKILVPIIPEYVPEGFSILEEDVNDYVNIIIARISYNLLNFTRIFVQ